MTERREESTPEVRQELMDKLLSWTSDFCATENFVSRSGYTNVSRAMNLCTGAEPKTRRERDFLAKFLAEIARRYPGASYPVMCIPPAPNTAHLNRMQ